MSRQSVEGPLPALDAYATVLIRVPYLGLRVMLRLLLGRKRRDNILRHHWLQNGASPSFVIMSSLYKFLGIGRYKCGTHLMKVQVPKEGYSYWCRIEQGDYTPGREDDVLDKFVPKEGDVVVDVGAHIGRYTIVASKRVGASGKVIAIEADPDNFDMLNLNVDLNELTNVLPVNCALYSAEAKIKLYKPADLTTHNSIMLARASGDDYVEVDAITLDSLMHQNQIGCVNWIKIDVEGAELEVLKGAEGILSKSKNISVLVEIHDIGDRDHHDRVLNYMQSHHFKIAFVRTYDNSIEKHVIFEKQ